MWSRAVYFCQVCFIFIKQNLFCHAGIPMATIPFICAGSFKAKMSQRADNKQHRELIFCEILEDRIKNRPNNNKNDANDYGLGD